MERHHLPRLILVALSAAGMALGWDIWWHQALGRESFFQPPHIITHISVMIAILSGWFGYYTYRERQWGWLVLVLLLIPLSAPFDELWHRIFGTEQVTSPWIIWSPPHVILDFALNASCLMLLPILRRDPDPVARWIFCSLVFANVMGGMLFLTMPVHPLGNWALLGFIGAGVVSLVLIFVLLMAQRAIDGFATATLVTILYLILTIGCFGKNGPGFVGVPFAIPSAWFPAVSTLVAALTLDLLRHHMVLVRGSLAGFIAASVFYLFSPSFLKVEYLYSRSEMFMAIFSGTIGGLGAAIVFLAVQTFIRLPVPSGQRNV